MACYSMDGRELIIKNRQTNALESIAKHLQVIAEDIRQTSSEGYNALEERAHEAEQKLAEDRLEEILKKYLYMGVDRKDSVENLVAKCKLEIQQRG